MKCNPTGRISVPCWFDTYLSFWNDNKLLTNLAWYIRCDRWPRKYAIYEKPVLYRLLYVVIFPISMNGFWGMRQHRGQLVVMINPKQVAVFEQYHLTHVIYFVVLFWDFLDHVWLKKPVLLDNQKKISDTNKQPTFLVSFFIKNNNWHSVQSQNHIRHWY